jgi:hypothetical protein
MATHTKWCQNPKCPEKKNSNQIRGSKGSKYYQSNRANGYGNGNFCTLGCYDEWSNIYLDRAIDAIGARIIEPVKVNMENAWYVEYNSNYRNGDWHYYYLLVNKLFNVRHPITKQQATINPSDEYSPRLTSAQAKVLAQQLGLTSQQ